VELSQYWRDMLALVNASDEVRGSILDSLKTLNQAVGTPDNVAYADVLYSNIQ